MVKFKAMQIKGKLLLYLFPQGVPAFALTCPHLTILTNLFMLFSPLNYVKGTFRFPKKFLREVRAFFVLKDGYI